MASSEAAATRKWSDYNDALQRCVNHANAERAVLGQTQLQPRSHFVEAYKFVPFAIERDVAWGSEAHHHTAHHGERCQQRWLPQRAASTGCGRQQMRCAHMGQTGDGKFPSLRQLFSEKVNVTANMCDQTLTTPRTNRVQNNDILEIRSRE